MTDNELKKSLVEEFSRLQSYMVVSDKNSEAYQRMKARYTELKVLMSCVEINVTALDIINE